MERIFLSRRNLLTLLSKLDRKKAGEPTHCTIIKRDWEHPVYSQTIESECAVTAVEDEEYYIDRTAGAVHPSDDPNSKPKSEG